MKYPWPQTIQEAAMTLDKIEPNWFKLINKSIDMYIGDRCILGQVFGSYADARDKYFKFASEAICVNSTTFGRTADVNEWISEIKLRKDGKLINTIIKVESISINGEVIKVADMPAKIAQFEHIITELKRYVS